MELEPIGIDFISNYMRVLFDPPDFQTFTFKGGFSALHSERAWSDVKNVGEQWSPELVDISGRFATFHRLLTLRLREISEAYNRCLLSQLSDLNGDYESPKDKQLFSNGFQVYIEGALHAFLADAAGLRDLIAEATWRLLMREPSNDVTTFATLLKRIKKRTGEHWILAHLHAAGSDDGWVKRMTLLRNSVIHIAPLANLHDLQSVQMRVQQRLGTIIPNVHYPLIRGDGSLRERSEALNFDDAEKIKSQLRDYINYVDDSHDALAYASDTFRRLVALAAELREAASIKHEIRKFTDADIIGEVKLSRNFRPKA